MLIRRIRWVMLFISSSVSITIYADTDALVWLERWKAHPRTLLFQAILPSDTAGQEAQSLKGTLSVAPGGLFRLDMSGQFDQMIVNDGRYLWIWDRSLAQVSQLSVTTLPEESPFAILTHSLVDLKQLFTIRVTVTSDHRVDYHFVPRQAGAFFVAADLQLVNGQPHSLLVHQTNNMSPVVIHITPLSQTPSPCLFHFVVPRGVDILDTHK